MGIFGAYKVKFEISQSSYNTKTLRPLRVTGKIGLEDEMYLIDGNGFYFPGPVFSRILNLMVASSFELIA
jgi:hypothetical protein